MTPRTRTTIAASLALAAGLGVAAAGPAPAAPTPARAPVAAAAADDVADVRAALAAVSLVHPDDVRGNLTLPTTGANGVALSWASARPDVVSTTGEVTRPATGAAPASVAMTVTGTKNGASEERQIVLTVQPQPAEADYEAYAFAYFSGESAEGERIYFGASKGNDPLDYDVLNDGRAVLQSSFGTTGLRDPFLIRSAEGDRFFLLATDLKTFPEVDFAEAQETGSKYLEVWESTDLVTWSNQRHIKVSSDFAGNTWAPEAFYDEEAGEYVVYWASALYPTTDTAGRDIGTSYQRMMYATTRDFVTFSEARPWVDVRRGAGRGTIDATVVRQDDGTYHRIIKDEATFTLRQERSEDLRATVTGSYPDATADPATGWQLVRDRVGVGQPNPWGGRFTEGEGPTMFADNEVPGRWYLFIDQPSYHGGQGYLAFRTDDLDSGNWTSVPEADLPSSPRHGTVIPVTQAELDRLREAYQPNLLVESVEDAAVTTRQGVAPTLPAQVPATFGDGRTGTVPVEWDDVDPAAYATPGTFTVQGTTAPGSVDDPVATVRVTDAQDPAVTATAEPDGEAGWFVTDPAEVSVAATDPDGTVEAIEHSVDGDPYVTTPGDDAVVPVPGDGVHTLRVRALDASGNTSAVRELTVPVDATAPTSRATAAGREVTVRAADATSGVARVETRFAGETAWTPYSGPVTVAADGGTVEYRAVDEAGNAEDTHELVVPPAGEELARTTVVAVATDATVRHGAPVRLTVRVQGGDTTPRGVVRVLAGGTRLAAAQLSRDGRAVVVVDSADLGTGRHGLVVRYDGSATHRAGEDRLRVAVTRALARTAATVRGRALTVRVGATPAGNRLPARARVVVRRGSATGPVRAARWVTLSRSGVGRWTLPALPRGRWSVVVTTAPTRTLTASRDVVVVRR